MEKIIVQKGKFIISNDPNVEIVTECLGSSLAVIIYDPIEKTGGVFVSIIPKTLMVVMGNEKNIRHGLDTGLPAFFRGFIPNSKRENLNIYLVGAATFLSSPPQFDVGDQLYRTAVHILSKNKMEIKAEHVRWQLNRMVTLKIKSGEIIVKFTDGQEINL